MPRHHRSDSTEFKRQIVAEYHAGETLHALCRSDDPSRNLIRILQRSMDVPHHLRLS